MKKVRFGLTLLASLISAQALCADDFSGFFFGLNSGINTSKTKGDFSTGSSSTYTGGAEFGYNAQWDSTWLLGLSGFFDGIAKSDHDGPINGEQSKYGANLGGADVKLGYQMNNWLPYLKLGFGRLSGSGQSNDFAANGLHGGAGLEYKLAPHWGLAGEWTAMAPSSNGTKFQSNSFTLNLNYYFGTPTPPPAPVVEAPAPAPAPAPEPMPAPPQVVTKHFTLKTDVLFPFDKATLKPEGKDALDQLYQQVKAMDPKEGKAIIVGYTDRLGSDKYNQDLGQRRAQAVADYLVAQGAPADKVEAQSKGKADPVTGDTCAKVKNRKKLIECLAPDRRVEVDVSGIHEETQPAAQ
ncbi:OmpA family protein [Silvimonas iriomotensis]|uniref:Porin OmpA n=1 Tax=Silvimonas iriomotensis TaxID=449662 RepID=A0ABQ2PBS9_9NEIS|nr:OmpA family protein [Silvimonas iriomotensis]GGP22672.1 porin OmpA [Silvimonas iriomotensis]